MIKLILIISLLIPYFFAFTIKTTYNDQSTDNNNGVNSLGSRTHYSSSYSSPINTRNYMQNGSISSHYSKSFRTDDHGNVLLSSGNIKSDGNMDGSNQYGTRYETNIINKGSDGGYNSFIDEISKNVAETEQEQKLIKNLNEKDNSNVFQVNGVASDFDKDVQSQIYESHSKTSSVSFSKNMPTKEKDDLIKNLREKYDNVKPIYDDNGDITGYSGSRTIVKHEGSGVATDNNGILQSQTNFSEFQKSFDSNMTEREKQDFLKKLREQFGEKARLIYNDEGKLIGYSSGVETTITHYDSGKVYDAKPISTYPTLNLNDLGQSSLTKTYGSEFETSSISFSEDMGTKEKEDLLTGLREKFDNIKPIYNDKNRIIGYSGSRESVSYGGGGPTSGLDSNLNVIYSSGSHPHHSEFETFDINMGVRERENFLKKLRVKYGENAKLIYDDKGQLVGYSSGNQINSDNYVGGKIHSYTPFLNLDTSRPSSVTKTYESDYKTSSISFSEDMGTKEKEDLLKDLREKFDNIEPIYNDKGRIIGYTGSRTSVIHGGSGSNLDSNLNAIYSHPNHSKLDMSFIFDKNMGVKEQEDFLKKLREKYGANAKLVYNNEGELIGYSSGDQINTGYYVDGKIHPSTSILNLDNLGLNTVTKTYGSEYETSSISFNEDMETKEKEDLLKNLRAKFDNVKPIYDYKNKIIGYSGSRTSVAYANNGENPRLDSTFNTVYSGGSQLHQSEFDLSSTFNRNMGVREQEDFLKKLREKNGANARLIYNDKGELIGYSSGDQIDSKIHSGSPILNLDNFGQNSVTKTYGSEYETSSISFNEDMATKEKEDLLKNLRDKFDNVKPIYDDKNKIIGYSGSRTNVEYSNTGAIPRLDPTLNGVYSIGSQSHQSEFETTFNRNMGVREQEVFLTKLREKYGANARFTYNEKGELIGYSSEGQTPYNYLHKPNIGPSTTFYRNTGTTYGDDVNKNVDKTYKNIKPIYDNEKIVGLSEDTSTFSIDSGLLPSNDIFNDLLSDFLKSDFKTTITFSHNLKQKELGDMIKFLQEKFRNGILIYNNEGKIIGFSSVSRKITENYGNHGVYEVSAKEQEDMIKNLQDKYGSNKHTVSSHSILNTQPPRLVNTYSWKLNSNSNLEPYGNTYNSLNNQNFEDINIGGSGGAKDDLYTEHFNFVKLHKFTKCPPNITGQFAVPEDKQKFLNCWKGEGAVQECGVETVFDESIRGCAKPNIGSEISLGSQTSFNVNEIVSGKVHNNRDKTNSYGFNSHSSGLGAQTTRPHDTGSNDLSSSGSSLHYSFSETNSDKTLDQQHAQHHQFVKLHNFSECPPGFTGQFSIPENNRKFLNCWNGAASVQECGAETVFDERIRGCTSSQGTNGNIGTTSSKVTITHGQGSRPIYSYGSSEPSRGNYHGSGSSAHSYSSGITSSASPSHSFGGSGSAHNIVRGVNLPNTNSFSSGTNSGIKTTSSTNRNQNSYASGNNDYTYSQQSGSQPTSHGYSHGSRSGSGYVPSSSSQGLLDINVQPISGNNVQGIKSSGTHGSYVSGAGSTYGSGTSSYSTTLHGSSPNDHAGSGLSSHNNLDEYHQHYNYVKQHKFSKCPIGVTGQFAIPENCHKFLNCWNGEGAVQECGAGTIFNEKIRGCDFPTGNEHGC